tara:strand:+ start:1452 stop:2429 length:978 start_codon:yes stop_codon:yes gene_type:complete
MKRVLVIGGAGYIGTVVANYLVQNNYKVKILDNLIYGNDFIQNQTFLSDDIEFIKKDMLNISKNDSIFKNIDAVILLAGLVGDPITKKYPDLSIKINRDGCKSVIDATLAAGIDRFIFISTCSNYGLIDSKDIADENYVLKPISLYAKLKVEIENYILQKNGNLCTTILRFATAFGESPRMRFDLTINEFIYELLINKKLLVYDPDTWRPYCHVNDFARLIEKVLKSEKILIKNEIFNAGSDINNFTKRQIVEIISRSIKDCDIMYKEHGVDPRNYRVDFSKIKKVLNFHPNYNVEDYMSKLVETIKNTKYLSKSTYGNYEINLK